MKDETLMKLALIVSLTGIGLLFFITEFAHITSHTIAEAIETGGDVKIHGTVQKATETGKLNLYTVEDGTGSVDVIAFDTESSLNEGDEVEIEGKVGEYKGKKQIEAKTITLT